MLSRFTDGFRNIVAQLGTDRDKASHGQHYIPLYAAHDLLTTYRASPLAGRIVDMPAEDTCREWRSWSAKGIDISGIEAEEKRLNVRGKVLSALVRSRLYGGSAIYIGTGDLDISKPLDPARIKRGGLQFLTVFGMSDLSPGQVEFDPSSPNYGMPKTYQLRGKPVHPSRLAIFHGREIEPDAVGSGQGWGDSVLLGCMDPVLRVESGAAAIASLILEAKVDVIGIEGLTDGLAAGGEEYERQVLARLSLVAKAKGINQTVVRDAQDTYEQKNASFSGLDNIMDRFMILASAASGIPVALLFGRSAAGMNATGEGDARAYYDNIKTFQTLTVDPALSVLDECLIRSALGDRPEELFHEWRSLWQPSAKERAEIGKLIVETHKTLAESTDLPPEALDASVVNALTEAGCAPGLEAAVEEFADDTTEGDDE